MNVYHQIRRKDCLSHQLWPHFKKGWPDTGRPVHFFWGLGDGQSAKIQECMDKNEEWWFVDTGYLTDQITERLYYYSLLFPLVLLNPALT